MIRRFVSSSRIRLLLAVIILTASLSVQSSFAATDCQTVLTKALQILQDNCDTLDRNAACYGNNRIDAEFQSDFSSTFQNPGDKVPIQAIKTLTTWPMDVSAGTWGLSILKLQTSLPDTLPGQNVTFLLYGDTSVQNLDGKMNSFYFTSGLGNPECKEVPQDAMMVRSPAHMKVSFTVDGVKISIASTIVVRAIPNDALTVRLLEGHATIETPAGWQTLQPGQESSVKLGGVNGLDPMGRPSQPTTPTGDSLVLPIYQAIDHINKTDTPLAISGCVTAKDGQNVTIDGYTIQVDPNDPETKGLKVGQCIQMNASVGQGKLKVSHGNAANKGNANGNTEASKNNPNGNGNGGNNGNGNGPGNGNANGNNGNQGGNGNGNGNGKNK